MMKNNVIQTKDYNIIVEANAITKLKHYININTLFIVDENVYNLHYEKIKNYLTEFVYIVQNAEHDKNINTYQEIVNYAIEKELNRNITVVAIGGGSIGDLAGFFAATYKRGVRFIQVPTTILAHDSAVGGKVGINHQNIKNVIGSFIKPEVVIYDVDFIKTLPFEEVISGYGEIIKHSLLSDDISFYYFILNKIKNKVDMINQDVLVEVLNLGIKVKLKYVEEDFFDQGVRQYLNFGHTLGHGIEVNNHMTHGEAVAYGLLFDIFISNSSLCTEELFICLKSLGFFSKTINVNLEKVVKQLSNDKKNKDDKICFIGLENIGKPFRVYLSINEFVDKFSVFQKIINQGSY